MFTIAGGIILAALFFTFAWAITEGWREGRWEKRKRKEELRKRKRQERAREFAAMPPLPSSSDEITVQALFMLPIGLLLVLGAMISGEPLIGFLAGAAGFFMLARSIAALVRRGNRRAAAPSPR